MMATSTKVGTAHQARLAYVYIRQSSLQQVNRNRESTDLQYRLVERAHQLNLVHVQDLVCGILAAGEHQDGEGEVFFIGGENLSTADICARIAEAMRKKPLVFHLPEKLIYVVGALGEATGRLLRRQVFFNVQKVREAVQDAWTCSIDKARDRIGWQPRMSISSGMSATYAWYLENKWL